jgi:hypothetical protein
MNVPMQSQPVQRSIATYSTGGQPGHFEGNAAQGMAAGGNGIVPSEYGVQASFSWRDLIPIAQNLLGAL